MLEKREGGCHCGRVRFRAEVDLDGLSQCSCTICTKKSILHLPVMPEVFELLRGKHALKVYTFGAAVAQHAFCSHCGMHAFYVPRSQPDQISVNARCLDGIASTGRTPAPPDRRRRAHAASRIERLSHGEGDPGPRARIRQKLAVCSGRNLQLGFVEGWSATATRRSSNDR